MKTEKEIQIRINNCIEELRNMKEDMEDTDITGQLKKDNPMIYSDWLKKALDILTQINYLSWVLEEPITEEVWDLTRIK